MGRRTVVFVCAHGAGKSRIAAAWFNGLALPGWSATSAGVEPQTAVSAHAPRLLAGTAVESLLDHEAPRPLSAVPITDLLVGIDCADAVSGSVAWQLEHQVFDDAMCAEIRERVETLGVSLSALDRP